MTLVFRADASPTIGGGHVMRCLALASALAGRGIEVQFAVSPSTPAAVPALARSGFDVILLPPDDQVAPIIARAPTAVIFDSYAIDARQEAEFRARVPKLVVIDDLASRPHDCDLLIDQNLGREVADYRGLVPAGCRILAGSRYAMLRPEFAAARASSLARRAADFAAARSPRRVLVTLGMTDVGGITGRILPAVASAAPAAAIDVVLGPIAPSLPMVRRLCADHPRITLHIDPPDICALMAAADLAVGAAGSTSWERCCLGLPTAMLILADNQRVAGRNLSDAGAALILEPGETNLADLLVRELGALFSDAGRLATMSASAAALIDGEGTDRICAELLSLIGPG